ncbi:MAG: M23 family metallopeptidase [Prolixibacteraceae bacterium]|nr:M23 family metallopeptidase [Prolixibacteraceae bacterium]
MKAAFLLLFSLFYSASFGQLTDREIVNLKTRRTVDDTSFIYSLPYPHGAKHLLIQGSNSHYSHKDELSLDFKMSSGSKICAARSGKVIAAKFTSNKGGLKPEFMSEGNYIIIEHEDGSTANYWHLQYNSGMVKAGDSVAQGQLIALSGNTGYSAFPHLHFQLFSKSGKQILCRFKTQKGVRYLRPGRWYRNK